MQSRPLGLTPEETVLATTSQARNWPFMSLAQTGRGVTTATSPVITCLAWDQRLFWVSKQKAYFLQKSHVTHDIVAGLFICLLLFYVCLLASFLLLRGSTWVHCRKVMVFVLAYSPAMPHHVPTPRIAGCTAAFFCASLPRSAMSNSAQLQSAMSYCLSLPCRYLVDAHQCATVHLTVAQFFTQAHCPSALPTPPCHFPRNTHHNMPSLLLRALPSPSLHFAFHSAKSRPTPKHDADFRSLTPIGPAPPSTTHGPG